MTEALTSWEGIGKSFNHIAGEYPLVKQLE